MALPQSSKRMILNADSNRIYDEEYYSEQKIKDEKFFIRPSRKNNKHKSKWFGIGMGIDLPFCAIVLILLVIGIIMMFSASYAFSYYTKGNSYFFLTRQLIFAAVGVGVMCLVSFFNYNKLHKAAPVVLIVSYLTLLIVLLLPGDQGVKRWIPIGRLIFRHLKLQSLQ